MEISRFQTTDGVGDGPAGGYTAAQFQEFLRTTMMTNPATEGVLYGILNALAVTGSATPISIASGAALVYGLWYQNDAAYTIVCPTPAGNSRKDYVVLRANMTGTPYTAANSQLFSSSGQPGRTVRADIIKGTPAASPALPALTQNANQWEIPIASLTITTGGVITLVDARTYASAAAALPLILNRQGGSASTWHTAGTTNYMPPKTKIQVGSVAFSISAGSYINPWSYNSSVPVTFPVPFSDQPIVMLSIQAPSGSGLSWACQLASGPSATGFTATVQAHTGGSGGASTGQILWQAVGPV